MKKIGESFKGIVFGFLLLIGGIILLWWNEGNNVRNLKTTAEMSKSYIDVSSEVVKPENEGKLVATSGPLLNEQELVDTTFNVKQVTPILRRVVEVYQWVEQSDTDSETNETTYTYKKEWSNTIINSSSFAKAGHDNPTEKPYDDEYYTSTEVKVGAFTLSSNQVNDLSMEGVYANYDEETINGLGYKITGKYVTNSVDPANPQIGDARISFVYNNSTEISVLAVQTGNSFTDFVSKAGKTINRIMDGKHSGAEMIEVIKKENKMLKWGLRVAGAFMIIASIAIMLKPISVTAGYVPVLGSIVGSAVGLIAVILGLAISLVVIAIAWVRFRPVLGISLLVVVAALIVLLVMRGKKKKAQAPAPVEYAPYSEAKPAESVAPTAQETPVEPVTPTEPTDNNQNNMQI